MPHSGHPLARGHLRLASPPAPIEPPQSRAILVLRGFFVMVIILWMSVLAVLGAIAALAPLLWRRAPVGTRLRPLRREARVIRLPARRRITPT